jgi:hypothetical protein
MLTSRPNPLDFALKSGTLSVLLLSITMSTSQSAVPTTWAPRGDLLTASIKAERDSYRVTDDVRIQVCIKNISSQPVEFFNGSPWVEVSISIVDGSGKSVARTGEVNSLTYHTLQGSGGRIILPGRTVTLEWDGNPWSNITNWGYLLKSPGNYTVQVEPHMFGFIPTSDKNTQTNRFVAVANNESSSAVNISIR